MSDDFIATNPAEGMTVEEHYRELREIASDLEGQRVRVEDLISDYQMAAEELVRAAEQAAEEHDYEFDDLVDEANELLSNIEQIDLGSVPKPAAWSMPGEQNHVEVARRGED